MATKSSKKKKSSTTKKSGSTTKSSSKSKNSDTDKGSIPEELNSDTANYFGNYNSAVQEEMSSRNFKLKTTDNSVQGSLKKGNKPYQFGIDVSKNVAVEDLRDKKKVIITEKSEVANALKNIPEVTGQYHIHNLGGNPFTPVNRQSMNEDNIVKSDKSIDWRNKYDRAFGVFNYPLVSEDTEVVMIGDDDYLGHYLTQNVFRVLNTDNVKIYNVESVQEDTLKEVLAGESKYDHNYNKYIAGTWLVEKQSEIAGSLNSALTGSESVLAKFSEQQRKYQGTPKEKISQFYKDSRYRVVEEEDNVLNISREKWSDPDVIEEATVKVYSINNKDKVKVERGYDEYWFYKGDKFYKSTKNMIESDLDLNMIKNNEIPVDRITDGPKSKHKEQSMEQTFSNFKNEGYLQGTNDLFLSGQELSTMGEILENELGNNVRVKTKIVTEAGVFDLEAEIPSRVNNIDASFDPVDIRDLQVKNTDDTVLLLINDLNIGSNQAEAIIQRLASQKVLTYPRTEFRGISAKEDISTKELADTWLSYLPEFSNRKNEMIKGIDKIREETGDLPRSGIVVIGESDYPENTIEYRTTKAIAKANIMSALGYKEIEGKLQIVNADTGERIDYRDATIVTKNEHSVGKVAEIDIEKKEGISEYKLFEFLSKNGLGTISTRSNMINKLERWGFVLKSNQGEYRLDDRGKLITLISSISDEKLTNTEFTKKMKKFRKEVEKNPEKYDDLSDEVYDQLIEINKKLRDEKLQIKAIQEYDRIMNETLKDKNYSVNLENDNIQIEGSKLNPIANSDLPPGYDLEIFQDGKQYHLMRFNEDGSQEMVTGVTNEQIEKIDFDTPDDGLTSTFTVYTIDGKKTTHVANFLPGNQ